MIAVNIMDINIRVLGSGDSLERASEVFSGSGEVVLPVLNGEGVLMGVLSKKTLPPALDGEAGKGAEAAGAKRAPLSAGGVCGKAFISAGPGATFSELKDKLPRARGVIYIVDNSGRLLGRVGEAELAARAAEYGENR